MSIATTILSLTQFFLGFLSISYLGEGQILISLFFMFAMIAVNYFRNYLVIKSRHW